MKNILTVDLEDWFVVENLKANIKFEEWDEMSDRVVDNTNRLLDLFDYYGVRATFFVLGWIAEKHPRLINRVSAMGHEVACHSYRHDRVDQLQEKYFREDTLRAVEAIEKACGITPVGYRAPSWSINSKVKWAYEELADMGFLYDSSMYPIKHDIYGEPGGPKRIIKIELDNGQSIYEVPASTVTILGHNFPVGGGGYLRHSPFWFTKKMIKKLNRENHPAVIYIHPWEIDSHQPRLEGLTAFQRYRQYGSIATIERKMELLLQAFDFCTIKDYIRQLVKKPIGFGR